MKRSTVFVILFVMLVGVTACQAAEPLAPTATATLIPTATETPLPTFTPTPEPTSTPMPNQEELLDTWKPAITSGVVLYAICPMIIDTAERLQSGEIDGFEATGEIIAEGIFLNALVESFETWQPEGQVDGFKSAMQAHLDVMKDVLARWFNDEITSADVPGLLEDECPAIEDTLEEIVEAATADGLSEESLGNLVTEIQQGLEELSGEMGNIGEED